MSGENQEHINTRRKSSFVQEFICLSCILFLSKAVNLQRLLLLVSASGFFTIPSMF